MANILVVGGATGIGRAAVEGFRARGDNVLLADAREGARDVATRNAPGRCVLFPDDPARSDFARHAVTHCVNAFGGLDSVLVTTALMSSTPLAGWTEAMWDESLALNLKMPFFVAQAAAPQLARSDNASILFLSSTAALRGSPGAPVFQATRAALPALARALTAELSPQDIRVNCVLPGWIDTPLNNQFWENAPDPAAGRAQIDAAIPLRRHGTPQEVSEMLLFLASPAGRYITGASIVVDGGFTAV